MKDDRAEWRQSIEVLTARLRSETGPGWASLRETLLSQGIDPAQAFLAIVYPDDVATLVAVVVASSDQMLRVDIDYSVGIEDYGEAMNRGHVVSWENDVAVIRSEERKVVDIALELLTSESRGD